MDVLTPPGFGRGYVEPDYSLFPDTRMAPPSQMKLIPQSEWDARIDEQERMQSSLEHLRPTMANGKWFESLDQNGQGYCWAHSITGAVIFSRAAAHQPYKRLSAFSVACKVKNFRDEGGWCGLSAKFAREVGIADCDTWPEKSMDRRLDNPATWSNAEQYKVVDDWVDLSTPVYDQNLAFNQIATCLLLNEPVAVDFNWWSHSVLAIRLVRVEAGSYGLKILNSWTDDWGTKGTSILRGQRAIPDGAVAIRSVRVFG